MRRISKENYYLDIAETVLERATCLRRVYGAIIVTNDEIIATGYNGAPRGRKNCTDLGFCSREALNVPAERLMERFVRGEESRSTEGSGLGLSIARSLTELQGGEFRLTVDGDLFKAEVTLPQAN